MDTLGYFLVLLLVVGFILLIIKIGGSANFTVSVGPPPVVFPDSTSAASEGGRRADGSYWLLWLVLCVLTSWLILSESFKGSCDGGLCSVGFFLLPLAWLGAGVVAWLLNRIARSRNKR
ncbi:hypothetical protein [Hymenobacter negativus]|uniref:Uncharacterized protein n=1 Tax=Hymenobacter negativus TaxID=2795026 RepID=A0ABS3QHQ7_9BACT|nr:hypothetical protein [Hymenobacter negativus]MBO2010518.1 hypothetical protein [Hymenobacter negativus]